MKQKLVIAGVLLAGALIAVGGVWFWRTGQVRVEAPALPNGTPAELAPEVEAVLERHSALIAEVLRNPIIVEAIQRANIETKDLTLTEILERDQRWRVSQGVDDFVRPFLTNETARTLIEFQESHPGFSEIFVTDVRGLNVGQTNKTTDYYQADEDWWTYAYDGGRGKASHGSIEFDESSQAEAIALYVPVRDPATQKVIGVAKAVLSIAAIKAEL